MKRNLDKANRAGQVAARTEPRAIEAKYLPASRQLRIKLTNIEILPGGDGLHWEALEFTISVPGLLASLFGPATWMSALGRLGGTRSTAAKAVAARRNGLRGGRPRVA